MKKMISSDEYYQLWKQVVNLINTEFDYFNNKENHTDKTNVYPQLIVMWAFLQLLRGEAFTNWRPHTPEYQKEFYKAEYDLWDKIKEFRKDMDWTKGGEADYKLEEWRNLFENPENPNKKEPVSN